MELFAVLCPCQQQKNETSLNHLINHNNKYSLLTFSKFYTTSQSSTTLNYANFRKKSPSIPLISEVINCKSSNVMVFFCQTSKRSHQFVNLPIKYNQYNCNEVWLHGRHAFMANNSPLLIYCPSTTAIYINDKYAAYISTRNYLE